MTAEPEARGMDSLLVEKRRFPPPPQFQAAAWVRSPGEYERLWRRSLEESDDFWLEQARALSWIKAPTRALRWNWDSRAGRIEHTWFDDGTLNVSFNCLDRHLGTPAAEKAAIIWQGEDEEDVRRLTYAELHAEVSRFAVVLRDAGVRRGDRVAIYLPMVPELAVAMLACARIGAIHSVVFGGFSAEALAGRMNDSDCRVLVTASASRRAGKLIRLKEIADEALSKASGVGQVIVVKVGETDCPMRAGRDLWYHEEMSRAPADCPPEEMGAEDVLFILYTSGSTGKPKGVVHASGGYLLHSALSHRLVFDIHDDDVYWCTADIGWVTGHSYIVYGPLANGATTLMFEGVPTWPDAGRFWRIVDKFGVTVFYTAPTAIRALMRLGDEWPAGYRLDTLRVLGSVGEPINPEAWIWYHEKIGRGRCPIVDTWWQTETGGLMISPLPGAHTLKPGSAMRPFLGVDPVVLRDDGTECAANEGGKLCIRRPWPGIMRTTWGDHRRFVETYFSQFADLYFTSDGCRVDEDGDYWLMGRIDDVVNVSGHRIGTAEVESALVSHPAVAEAAVTPMPHAVKGQALYAFVTLVEGTAETDELKRELALHVRRQIGPIAVPDAVQFAPSLPKTRSGKIMRRILRKIAEGRSEDLGDISTLAEPGVVEVLVKGSLAGRGGAEGGR